MATLPAFESVTLRTDRLTLRPLAEADAPAYFELFSHPEVTRYLSRPPMTDVSQARERIAQIQDDYRTRSSLQLGLERNADRALLGICLLFHFEFGSRRAEIGYALRRAYWGAGYMHEALRALVDYGFGVLDLNRLEADIDPRNTASARTLERLGFVRERWIVSGEVSDSGLYGLLRREWAAPPLGRNDSER